MAETVTAPTPEAAEPTTEQQLETLFKETPDETAIEVTPEAAAPTPEAAPTPQPTDIEAKLNEIPDAPEVKEDAKPTLTADQQQILAAFPTPEVAKQVQTESGYFQTLNTALAQGDYETVEQMFAPDALEGFKEHFYKKYVASGELVDRWISEKEGNPQVSRAVTAQEQRIARLEAQLAERHQNETKQSQQQQQAQLQKSYNDHLTGVFDKFNFSAADRRYVAADVTAKVSADPTLMASYRSGNMVALNKAIKESIRDYSTKDQAAQVKREETVATQMTKKPLIAGQAAVQTGALPDDINQVPKDQRDNWVTEQLKKLMK